MRSYRLYLQDIFDAIESIAQFVSGMSLEAFHEDDRTASAVFRKFEIIGEAAKHVPSDIQRRYPEVPWREMARMRDRMIHGYFGIDHEEVWKTINDDLPALREQMRRVIQEIGQQG